MRNFSIYLLLIISTFCPGIVLSQDNGITKVGEWGTGQYRDIFVQGNYAYCAADRAGLDIINIQNPSQLERVGNCETSGPALAVYVSGNYAYVADTNGLQVIDIAAPSSPSPVGTYNTPGYAEGVFVSGNYAYVADGGRGLQVIDITDPSTPSLAGSFETPINEIATDVYVSGNYAYLATGWEAYGDDTYTGGLYIINVSDPTSPTETGNLYGGALYSVYVKENYAYAADKDGLKVIDISNPSIPTQVGNYVHTNGRDIYVNGNYVYLVVFYGGFEILDISSPSLPVKVGGYDTSNEDAPAMGIFVKGNYAYTAYSGNGLEVIDVSTPASPSLAGNYDLSGYPNKAFVHGNYAYVVDAYNGFEIIDISNPASPALLGSQDFQGRNMDMEVYVQGNYAYVTDRYNGLVIFDISNSSAPSQVAQYDTSNNVADVYVRGTYAYLADFSGLVILDVSNPSTPTLAGEYNLPGLTFSVYVNGDYAYVTNTFNALEVINISNPASPTLVGSYDTQGRAKDVCINGNYAYIMVELMGLQIIDISEPSSPSLVGSYETGGQPRSICFNDGFVYVADGDNGLQVINVSEPTSPTLAADYDTPGWADGVHIKGNNIYVADGSSGRLLILYIDSSAITPELNVNRTSFTFASDTSGNTTGAQPVFISNSGGGTLVWSAAVDQNWLNCSPPSGTGSGEVFVFVETSGLSAGTYNGTVTVSVPGAANSPQTIAVTLTVYDTGQTSGPFGSYATPTDGSTVSGSVPFTGWALDDIEVQSVQLFRETQEGLTYIGDAVAVEGARPDVEGNQVTLGAKTITVDNANAVRPFGTIDTPAPGGIVSGSQYNNIGWVLTPLPNTIASDGSTIQVWVDGVALGNPVYNIYREDIASLFPCCNNSGGIGSRYFTIQNSAQRTAHSAEQRAQGAASITDLPGPVQVIKGYRKEMEPQNIYPNARGKIFIKTRELARIKIQLFPTISPLHTYTGYQVVNDQLRGLPIGSSLDRERGIFYWQAGPGFLRQYRLIFIRKDEYGNRTKRDVLVNIIPRF